MVREARIQEMPKGALKIEYEPEVDILTIYLQDPETPLSHSSEAEPGVNDYVQLVNPHHVPASSSYPPLMCTSLDMRLVAGCSGVCYTKLNTLTKQGAH